MTSQQLPVIRRRLSEILQANRPHDPLSRIFDFGLILIITLNLLAIVLESIPELEQNFREFFYWFELISVAIFTAEYLARVWSSIDNCEVVGNSSLSIRIRYMLSPMALIDLIAILPFYLAFLIPIDLRILRIIRLLRVFKLTRYYGAMDTLLAVLYEESSVLLAAFFVMFLMMLLAASGIYLIENKIQPEAFGSIPDAMWWALATLTTVGYGDVVPITSLGKAFGGIVIFIGVGMVALPTGIIASGFANTFRRQRVRYETVLDEALDDGVLTEVELDELRKLREQLDIVPEDAELIYKAALERVKKADKACPHCGRGLCN